MRLDVSSISTGSPTLGFKAGDAVPLTIVFDDTNVARPGSFGATLLLENAERATRFVQISGTDNNQMEFTYTVVAGDNGAFGLRLTGIDGIADANGNKGLATGWETTVATRLATLSGPSRRIDTRGPRVTGIRITAPSDGTVHRGDGTTNVAANNGACGADSINCITFELTFDESVPVATATVGPVDVQLRVKIGNANTAASCEDATARDAASEKLTCRLAVAEGWSGAISTPANPLNYDFIRDGLSNDASPTFAAQQFPGVTVDAVRPTITSATIRVPRAEIGSNVVVQVTFSEDINVTGTPSATISFTDNTVAARPLLAGPLNTPSCRAGSSNFELR